MLARQRRSETRSSVIAFIMEQPWLASLDAVGLPGRGPDHESKQLHHVFRVHATVLWHAHAWPVRACLCVCKSARHVEVNSQHATFHVCILSTAASMQNIAARASGEYELGGRIHVFPKCHCWTCVGLTAGLVETFAIHFAVVLVVVIVSVLVVVLLDVLVGFPQAPLHQCT